MIPELHVLVFLIFYFLWYLFELIFANNCLFVERQINFLFYENFAAGGLSEYNLSQIRKHPEIILAQK